MGQPNSLSIITGTRHLTVNESAGPNLTEELLPDAAIPSQGWASQTQQPDESDGVISQSIPPPVLEKQPWGFLSCTQNKVDIRLVKDDFLVGRNNPSADHLFEEKLLGRLYRKISHKHFRIVRTPIKSGQWLVSIQDLSATGTYVNGVLIGKNRSRLLLDKSRISVVNSELAVFVFYDQQSKIAVPGIPPEITSNYLVADEVGKGGFGSVYLVISQNSRQRLAMKAIKLEKDMNERTRNGLLHEPNIMYKISHPNIVQIKDVYISNGCFLFIFMEYVPGGDLFQYLNARLEALNEAQAKFIFYQLVSALAVLHRQNIVHRDIKPLNILCSHQDAEYPQIKLTDFGLSKILNRNIESVQTLCGTRAFAAPELNMMFSGSGRRGKYFYDSRCDVWSVGIVIYYCLSRRRPYAQQRNVAMVEQQMRKDVFKFEPAEKWQSVSSMMKYLLRRMIKYECLARPFAEELRNLSYFTEDRSLNIRFTRTCLEKRITSEEFEDENIIPAKMPRIDNSTQRI